MEPPECQEAPEKSSNPARPSTFNRVRRAYFTGLNLVANWWFDWWQAVFAFAILCVMGVTLIFWAPTLQIEIGKIDKDLLTAIDTLLVTIGGSLIGATAIVSAMVMYALQVNVERMPHKLFRRLSADLKIFLAFVGTFSLATLVAALSMVVTQQDVVLPLFTAFWSLVLILTLFGFAYRRTLDLVSPSFQLIFIVKEARKDLARWEKHAERISRSIPSPSKAEEDSLSSSLDIPRLQFYQQFPYWTQRANEALFYALSFATRYAEKGDYGVVNAAYSAVLAIHACYIKAKGKTFVAANGFLDSPLTGDAFLSDTLETLRQMHREAVTQGNERYIVANFQVMAKLAELYLSIDYASRHVTSKTHANLAAHYLADAIKEVIPHNRPDVLMKGARLLGYHAQLCLSHDSIDNISQLSERISEIALVGIARQEQMPVTTCAVNELGKLSISILQSTKRHDLRFSLHELRRDIHYVAMLVIKNTKDTPLSNRHSHALGGYYSATDPTAFAGLLTELSKQLVQVKADNQAAQQVFRNIRDWSDQLYDTQKELLLESVAVKSHFTFDMIHWVMQVTNVLAELSKAKACPPHIQVDLQKNANWLISTFSWLPDDKDSATHLEHFQLHERLFESAMSLYANECYDISKTVAKLLVSWAFRAGRHENGWGTLEQSIYCVAVLSLRPELQPVTSVGELAVCMMKYPISQELLDRTARDIRSTAQSPFEDRHLPGIEHDMSLEDPKKLSETLMIFANVLSPGTASELIRSRHVF